MQQPETTSNHSSIHPATPPPCVSFTRIIMLLNNLTFIAFFFLLAFGCLSLYVSSFHPLTTTLCSMASGIFIKCFLTNAAPPFFLNVTRCTTMWPQELKGRVSVLLPSVHIWAPQPRVNRRETPKLYHLNFIPYDTLPKLCFQRAITKSLKK